MKLFKCDQCGNTVYFEDKICEVCGRHLAYAPPTFEMISYSSGQEPDGFRLCANAKYGVCNWLVPTRAASDFCGACRHNRMVPDLSLHENCEHWRRVELAKRRVFYTLHRFGFETVTRLEDPAAGLAFDILADSPALGAPRVMTGHANGVITLNLKEADDITREKSRFEMGETYRTVLGHFRHEIGHYYWDRLVEELSWIDRFRAMFGDERENYRKALEKHYSMGPPANWHLGFISGYASSHPWEDFAESWAHYFHIIDTLETAVALGVRVGATMGDFSPLAIQPNFDPYNADLGQIIGAWLPFSFAMNAINRSMGELDLYPFTLSRPAIDKIEFVHDLIYEYRRRRMAEVRQRAA